MSMMEEIVSAIEGNKGVKEPPRSCYEAYSLLRKLEENAKAISDEAGKLMKELWAEVKAENEDGIIPYESRLEEVSKKAEWAWAELSTMAGLSAVIGGNT